MRKGVFYRRDAILDYLKKKPAHTAKLASHFQIHIRGVQQSIVQLKELKQIYICDWIRTTVSSDLRPVWAWRSESWMRDIPKPPRLTNSERCRRYQQSKKGKVQQSWINSIFNVSSTQVELRNEMQ